MRSRAPVCQTPSEHHTCACTSWNPILFSTGSAPLAINSITTAAPFHQANDCPTTLQPAEYCRISVNFHPTSLGNFAGSLSIVDNAADGPQTVTLQGAANCHF